MTRWCMRKYESLSRAENDLGGWLVSVTSHPADSISSSLWSLLKDHAGKRPCRPIVRPCASEEMRTSKPRCVSLPSLLAHPPRVSTGDVSKQSRTPADCADLLNSKKPCRNNSDPPYASRLEPVNLCGATKYHSSAPSSPALIIFDMCAASLAPASPSTSHPSMSKEKSLSASTRPAASSAPALAHDRPAARMIAAHSQARMPGCALRCAARQSFLRTLILRARRGGSGQNIITPVRTRYYFTVEDAASSSKIRPQ